MSITSITSFIQKKQKGKGVRGSRGVRVLAYGDIRIARDEHFCDKCQGRIFPGQKYRREVLAFDSFLHVEKSHYPECPGPTEWERMTEEVERQREQERRAQRQVA